MPKIIAICNQKGGVGKTSTAVSLSSGLALKGHKTLLIDLDPQGNSTSGTGINKKEIAHSIYDVLIEGKNIREVVIPTEIQNLYLIPANENLAGAEVELVSQLSRENRLKKVLQGLDSTFQFVIIDCPPSLGLLTLNSLTASNSVIVPIQCEYYALEGLGQLTNTLNLVRENLNPNLEIEGILMTMADFRTKLTQEVINEVKKFFVDKVYDAVIPRNIRLSEAPGFGKPIFLYDKDSEGAKRYMEFIQEFLRKNEQHLKKAPETQASIAQEPSPQA